MTNRLRACLAASATIVFWATPATAQSLFDNDPVADTTLNAIRAASQLTTSHFWCLQDGIARDDFRVFAAGTGVAMDNWWAQQGASLIAASISTQR